MSCRSDAGRSEHLPSFCTTHTDKRTCECTVGIRHESRDTFGLRVTSATAIVLSKSWRSYPASWADEASMVRTFVAGTPFARVSHVVFQQKCALRHGRRRGDMHPRATHGVLAMSPGAHVQVRALRPRPLRASQAAVYADMILERKLFESLCLSNSEIPPGAAH